MEHGIHSMQSILVLILHRMSPSQELSPLKRQVNVQVAFGQKKNHVHPDILPVTVSKRPKAKKKPASLSEKVPEPRIIAGHMKGAKLFFQPDCGTRPATHFVRSMVFNWLSARLNPCGSGSQSCLGLHVLDLFAGSGAYGFEALSRGAQKAFFFDSDPKPLQWMRQSALKFRLSSEVYEIAKAQWPQLPALLEKESVEKVDLVFIAPPYESPELAWDSLRTLCKKTWITQETWIVMELRGKRDYHLPDDLEGILDVVDQRACGPAWLLFLTKL